jgi:hypothetical protein
MSSFSIKQTYIIKKPNEHEDSELSDDDVEENESMEGVDKNKEVPPKPEKHTSANTGLIIHRTESKDDFF